MQFKIFIGLVLTLIIVVFIPVYWATEPGRQENALARQTAESVDRGAEKYASNCAACHGSQGERGLGRALAGTMLDSKALQRVIARGVPGTAMPPWGVEDGGPLKDYQIRDLVAFIESLGAPAAAAPKPVAPPSTPTPAPPSPSLSPAAPSVDARALYTGQMQRLSRGGPAGQQVWATTDHGKPQSKERRRYTQGHPGRNTQQGHAPIWEHSQRRGNGRPA